MPASGYELGMLEFVFPGVGVFLLGACIMYLAGRFFSRFDGK